MTILSPKVHTYHCICTSLLLATTHTLSSLPRRAAPALDSAFILPLPSSPPSFSEPEPQAEDADANQGPGDGEVATQKDMPPEGYSILLGVSQDKKTTIIRREDGFEKRLLFRCARCSLVVGYEILSDSDGMDLDGKEKASEGYQGKVIYLLPAGIVSTEVMAKKGTDDKGAKWITEDNLEIRKAGAVPVFE